VIATLLSAVLQLAQVGEAPPAPRPSIVLVTVDTLRREHLGCYGYFRPTSPHVDALAREDAVLFERALASMATTFPSHLSMMTGLYPHQHGYTSNPMAVRQPFRSEPGRVTAAEALKALGYHTAAVVSSVVLSQRTGIDAGFERFVAPTLKEGKFSARASTDRALAWLAEQPPGEPLFLWLHLWDAHEPNEPPPECAALFRSDDALRDWVRTRGIDAGALAQRFGKDAGVGQRFFGWTPPPPEPELPPGKGRFVDPDRGLKRRAAARVSVPIDEERVLALFDRYDACVRAVDDEIGRLVQALKAGGRWEDAAFVFTADHGQTLGEGNFLGHGRNTNLNTFVPLVVHFPSGTTAQPGRRGELVSLVDLMPTLLARVEGEALAGFRGQWEGEDVLAAGFRREEVLTTESTEFHGAEEKPFECALQSTRWKYVQRAGGAPLLFDLTAAGEALDVGGEHAELVAEMGARLKALLARRPMGEKAAAGKAADGKAADGKGDAEAEELLKQLEALGYGGDD